MRLPRKLVAFILVFSLTKAEAAIVQICGFETGTALESTTTSGTFSVQATTKRTGGYALRINPTTTNAGFADIRFLGANGDAGGNNATIYTRFYFRYGTKPSSNNEPIYAAVSTAPATKLEIRIDSSGQILAYDSALSLLGTGSTVLAQDTWYRIEVLSGTGAAANYEVRIDGTTELSGTANQTVTNHGRMQFGKVANRNGNTVNFYYDDIAIDLAAFPGAGQIEVMVPDGDGSAVTWTVGAGGGADWENVDELPHDTATSYLLSTLVSGNASLVTLESATSAGISGTINAVKNGIIRNRNGGSNGSINTRVRSGGTNSDTSGGSATASAIAITGAVLTTDPSTGSAWTTSGLDGVEIGILENSTTNASRWTAGYLSVDFTPSAGGGETIDAQRQIIVTE